MEYRRLGKSALKVSRICLGSWQAYGWASSNDEQFLRTIDVALEQGVNFIDTAFEYGKGYSEKLIGKALRGRRDKVIIGTKFFYNMSSPGKLRSSLDNSLKNLGTDYIDLYQQHWPPKTPPLQETLDELVRLKCEGKIRAIGISNWEEREFDEVTDLSPIDSLQPCYNLLWRKVEDGVISLCERHNISVLPYSPLCQGLLAGKFEQIEQIPKDPRRQNVFSAPETFQLVQGFLVTLRAIASEYNSSPAEVSLAWLMSRTAVTSVIVGCSRPDHIRSACQAVDLALKESTICSLDEASKPLKVIAANFKSLWNWRPRG